VNFYCIKNIKNLLLYNKKSINKKSGKIPSKIFLMEFIKLLWNFSKFWWNFIKFWWIFEIYKNNQ